MNDFLNDVKESMFRKQPVSDLGLMQGFIADKFEKLTQMHMTVEIRMLSKILVLIKQGETNMATLQETLNLVQKMFDEVNAAHGVISASAGALAAKDQAIADLTAKDAQDVADKNAALASASTATAALAALQAKVDSGELVSSADVAALSTQLVALEAQLATLAVGTPDAPVVPVTLAPNLYLAPVAQQDPAPVDPVLTPVDVPVDPAPVDAPAV